MEIVEELGNEPETQFGPQAALDESEESVVKRCRTMFQVMMGDREALDLYADYSRGKQSEPYIPNYADPTNRILAERATLNLMRLAVAVPAQISYIDGYSRKGDLDPAEWKVWHRSNMPAKQTRLFTASLTYGAGYTMLSNPGTDDRRIDLLSSRDTVCFFEDAVNDTVPVWGLTIKSHPNKEIPGRAIYMDAQRVVHLDFDGGDFKVAKNGDQPHSLGITPMVRWPAILDDRGYAKGVVEDLIAIQDRVNQTAFDLLVDQSFGAYKVRTAAGLVGEPLFKDNGEPLTDADGRQVYGPIEISQRRILAAEDPATKFGTLEETPLDGFISALDASIKHFAVVGQLPPHSLMGSLANLSAETLQAAMAQTTRFTQMLKGSWGDSARTMMQIVARDMQITDGIEPENTEIRWRDMSDHTLAAIVDALGKGAEMLGIPGRGLWSRFPGATDSEIKKWEDLRDEEIENGYMEDPTAPEAALNRESSPQRPSEPSASSGGDTAG